MCDCERPEFFKWDFPQSRKHRKCDECRGPIVPGERYCTSRGRWDGKFDNFKTCLACERIRTWLEKRIGCCVPFMEIGQYLHDERISRMEAVEQSMDVTFSFEREAVLTKGAPDAR